MENITGTLVSRGTFSSRHIFLLCLAFYGISRKRHLFVFYDINGIKCYWTYFIEAATRVAYVQMKIPT